MKRDARLTATFFSGGLLGTRAAEPEGNPGLSNHNSGSIAMHPFIISHATKGRPPTPVASRLFAPFSATMWCFTNP
jgi:hypothetical protein